MSFCKYFNDTYSFEATFACFVLEIEEDSKKIRRRCETAEYYIKILSQSFARMLVKLYLVEILTEELKRKLENKLIFSFLKKY